MFWVGLSIGALYYTDMPKKIMEDKRINRLGKGPSGPQPFADVEFLRPFTPRSRPFLNFAVACLTVNCVIMAYLTIWVPLQERCGLRWEIGLPAATTVDRLQPHAVLALTGTL